MIVALLVLIVLILLFGTGVVKGWLANAAGYVCGGLVILVVFGWFITFLGDDGAIWALVGIAVAAVILWAVGSLYQAHQQAALDAANAKVKAARREALEAQKGSRAAERKPSQFR